MIMIHSSRQYQNWALPFDPTRMKAIIRDSDDYLVASFQAAWISGFEQSRIDALIIGPTAPATPITRPR